MIFQTGSKKLYERRNINITHPLPQALLTKEIALNWSKLQKFLSNRKFSEDKIEISENFDRAIKGINFALHRAKTEYIASVADWLVKTDISRFYPTIYTHSIPWAAHGKEKVKRSLQTYDGSFADRLDFLVRACNRNQTVGIPIGPETSRILAELISARIDSGFAEKCDPRIFAQTDRLQDDWIVGTDTLENAERILSVITACYRDFGLEINGSKTSVTHILASKSESWKDEISSFLSHGRGRLSGSSLSDFLKLCIRLQLSNSREPVLNYALAIIENRKYKRDDIQVLETFLLKAAAVSPESMDRVCRILLNVDHDMGGLSYKLIETRFLQLIIRHIENGALFEVIWLLYTLRGLNRPFSSKKFMAAAENVPSSALRLIVLDMYSKHVCLSKPPLGSWEAEISDERIQTDWTWLYAYEAMRHGWLPDKHSLLAKPFLAPFYQRNVVFYDPRKNVKTSASVAKAQRNVRLRQKLEVVSFMKFLRGVDLDRLNFGDY